MMNLKNIKKALKNGIVEITYYKMDGSLRTAKATLNADVIRESGYVPKRKGATIEEQLRSATMRTTPIRFAKTNLMPYNIVYFDMECKEWRTANMSLRSM